MHIPLWLTALLVTLFAGGAIVYFGHSPATKKSALWTPEMCNQRLETDVETYEAHQEKYKKAQTKMNEEARRGNSSAAEANRKAMVSIKDSTATLLRFFDNNVVPVCGKDVFRADLMAKVDIARKFAKDGVAAQEKTEGMPNLRVTNVTSTFVPYETTENGSCSGPYLNLVFTVTNQGEDFPRPIDLKTYEETAQKPEKDLNFFTVAGELDFGGDMKKRLDFTIKGDKGHIQSGQSIEIPTKIKVENNQTHARVKGTVSPIAYLKINGGTATPYETDIDIPIWDIYTDSHEALDGKDDGGYYIGGRATVSNLGKTQTPGPIQGSYIINEIDPSRRITSWLGKTTDPVSGKASFVGKSYSTLQLPKDIVVISSIIPLCPNGQPGDLSDGNTANNGRDLHNK